MFERPTRAGIPWADIENLLRACGADIEERTGARVAIMLNDVLAIFHRPHPRKETDKGSVASVRRFLMAARVRPGHEEGQ